MQEILDFIANFVSRPDKVLMDFINNYGNWIYVFLFLIIFAETGLIIASFIMPFLPGDALIFAVGMIAANDQQNHLHIEYIIPLLMVAAILGDTLNYYVGSRFGSWLLANPGKFYIQPKHIEKATQFFEEHGKKAIIIARFMPVVRTIIPFICGTTKLNYRTFITYSFIGAVLWVGVISLLGYFLGGFKFVQDNLEYFIFGIIIAANLPLIMRLFKSRFSKK
ncbi:VTT domain-containing protein [Moheibacter lacus]|uniref:VTT domain-containing protein n=1 Tax=Moheibacter lacus TaxID=2745851 RepID=A0A838ZUI0_9FLAO|nr:VTT domain-containing protein [Moheibacter lacus]MBA5630611.1 VTT domain-containing protein [Moheibacter lacus]